MVDFALTEEQRDIRDWVRTFVERELMPLENEVLRREREGSSPGLNPEEFQELRKLAQKSGFWGVQTPPEYGGMGLDGVTAALIATELGRTFLSFQFGGEADNILYHANAEQRERYLLPTINGDRRSCFTITEPEAGSDAKAIQTRARKEGTEWIINGEKRSSRTARRPTSLSSSPSPIQNWAPMVE